MSNSYEVRMDCYNCGHTAVYDIPVRREIVNFERTYDAMTEDWTQITSSYQRVNETDQHNLNCSRCLMPYLQVYYPQLVEKLHIHGDDNA